MDSWAIILPTFGGVQVGFRIRACLVGLLVLALSCFRKGVSGSELLCKILRLMIKIRHYLKDLKDPKTMEILAKSLLWVMQDLYHQPYFWRSPKPRPPAATGRAFLEATEGYESLGRALMITCVHAFYCSIFAYAGVRQILFSSYSDVYGMLTRRHSKSHSVRRARAHHNR